LQTDIGILKKYVELMAPFAASFGEQKYSLAYVLPTINHNQYCVKTKKYFGIYCTRRRHAQ